MAIQTLLEKAGADGQTDKPKRATRTGDIQKGELAIAPLDPMGTYGPGDCTVSPLTARVPSVTDTGGRSHLATLHHAAASEPPTSRMSPT